MISEEYRHVVAIDNAGKRIDKFLAERFSNLSRTQIKKSFDERLVTCNGFTVKPKTILAAGDKLLYHLILPDQPKLHPISVPLEIIFEDDDIIIINKKPDVIVHAGNAVKSPTLVEMVLAHCNLSPLGGELRPGVVHRLDKGTSGAIIFAKSDKAYLNLIKMFATRQIHKTYQAIVKGSFNKNFGIVDGAIGRDKSNRTKMTIAFSGRKAVTHWELVRNFGEAFAFLNVKILTGRTHQIRVHLSSIGHPIVGDITYGNDKSQICARPMLHAHKLAFKHPVSGKILTIMAGVPQDFQETVTFLSKKFLINV